MKLKNLQKIELLGVAFDRLERGFLLSMEMRGTEDFSCTRICVNIK